MTEPGTTTTPPKPVDEDTGYSKDYWDIVFEQLAKRRLFKIALAFLALLYASAIYAPYIANDRPYVIESIDYSSYDKARKSLYPVSLGLRGRVSQTPEKYLEERTEGSDQTYEQAVEAERSALSDRIETMRQFLPAEHHERLDGFLGTVDRAVGLAVDGKNDEAKEVASELKDLAKGIRDDLEPLRPAEPGEEEAKEEDEEPEGVELLGSVEYPLFEATTPYEIFFMVLWLFVLLWPVWNPLVNRLLLGGDRERIRSARTRKVLVSLVVPVLAAIGWKATVGGEMTFNTAEYKQKITSGEIEPTRVIFPPVALGFAETHLVEEYRPPTWSSNSEMSEEGFYVRGARVPTVDEVTGFKQDPIPVDVRYGEADLNAGTRHLLGTDGLGRDLLVRALYGGRVSLSVGLVSMVILMLIGVIVGCIAGYFGGWVDLVISRFIEIVICFPVFFLILVVVAFIGPSILNIMVVIGLLRWTGVARLARAEFLRLKELDFVVGADALGFSSRRIVFRHILPNAMGPLLVAASFSVAAGILTESGLSFLGFGIQLPIPSWGSLVNDSKNAEHWWIHVFPGLLIFVTVLCYNLVGEGIRDAMDPKLKE